MAKAASTTRLVLCVKNEGYPASLERRKVYLAVPDPQANTLGLIRVIDESGEDYLYPGGFFVPITLGGVAKKALAEAF